MAKPVGRPKELFGPLVTVRLDTLTHLKLAGLAKDKGLAMSQTVREVLARGLALEQERPGE